jgi:hypothetical protein
MQKSLAEYRNHLKESALIGSGAYADLIRKPASLDILVEYLHEQTLLIQANINSLAEVREIRRSPAFIWWQVAEACAVAYERTHDLRLIRWFTTIFDWLLEKRDSITGRADHYCGRSLPTWGAIYRLPTGQLVTQNSIFITGLMVMPVARMCIACKSTSHLDSEKLRQYIDVIEQAISVFIDTHVSADNGIWYRSDKGLEPFNHVSTYATTLLRLNRLTNNPKYSGVANGLLQFFLSNMNRYKSHWTWGYKPGDKMPEPIWKANKTIMLPLEADTNGIIRTREELRNVFLKGILTGENQFNAYISLERRKNLDLNTINDPKFRHRIQGLASWIQLASPNDAVEQIIIEAFANRRDIFPSGWFETPITAHAYAHRLVI